MTTRVAGSCALVIAVAVAFPAAARAGGGFLVPPIRLDVGPRTLAEPTAGEANALQLVVGVHWASLWPRPTPVDVGFGFVSAAIDLPGDDGDGGGHVIASQGGGSSGLPDALAHQSKPQPPPGAAVATACYGSYFELAGRVVEGHHWRAWLGGRGELLRAKLPGRDPGGLGVAARFSVEVYAGAVGGGSNAVMAGTVAAGVYVEAGYRDLPGPLGGAGVSAGFSMRLPFLAAGG